MKKLLTASLLVAAPLLLICGMFIGSDVQKLRAIRAETDLLTAIAIDAHLCQLPPAAILIQKDGTSRVVGAEELTAQDKASISTLAKDKIHSLTIPCDAAGGKQSGTVSTQCDRMWASQHPRLWRDGHCANISLITVANPTEDAVPVPMSPEHRALRDLQGHLGEDTPVIGPYKVTDFCHGHVKTVIKQKSGNFTIVCYPAELTK